MQNCAKGGSEEREEINALFVPGEQELSFRLLLLGCVHVVHCGTVDGVPQQRAPCLSLSLSQGATRKGQNGLIVSLPFLTCNLIIRDGVKR